MENLISCLLALVVIIPTALSLECYTCVHQDNNKDKCVKTVKQCEQHQDICRTDISWGIPPYWTPHGERIHMISKDCDTSKSCQKAKYELRHRCKRDWYLDWDCVECCSGDQCNYYATLGASGMQVNVIVLASTVLTVLYFLW